MIDALKTLKELREKTPERGEPWESHEHDVLYCAQANNGDPYPCQIGSFQYPADAAFAAAAHKSLPQIAEYVKQLEDEARFLLDRLREFESDGDTKTEPGERDWHGHIAPSISRLSSTLKGSE